MRDRRDPWSLRAADADRERVAELLRDHCAAGRLSFDELDERLESVYAARTYADLQSPMADLPRAGMAPPSARTPAPRGHHSGHAAGAIVLWSLAAMTLAPAVFAVVGALAMATFALALTAASLVAPFVIVAMLVAWTIHGPRGRRSGGRRRAYGQGEAAGSR